MGREKAGWDWEGRGHPETGTQSGISWHALQKSSSPGRLARQGLHFWWQKKSSPRAYAECIIRSTQEVRSTQVATFTCLQQQERGRDCPGAPSGRTKDGAG